VQKYSVNKKAKVYLGIQLSLALNTPELFTLCLVEYRRSYVAPLDSQMSSRELTASECTKM